MTRIDFYVLESDPPGGVDMLACRLAEKAYGLKHRVYLHTDDDASSARLDELLWRFRAGSFVPHRVVDGAKAPDSAPEVPEVLIGHGEDCMDEHWDLLINLTDTVPAFFSRYARVAELVGSGEAMRRAGRERYQYYRDRGYRLHTHRM